MGHGVQTVRRLTFGRLPGKANHVSTPSPIPAGLYAQWRGRHACAALHDGDRVSPPPEKWLQLVWHHQRLQRDALNLTDGRRVRILHPGFHSREGGPDFRDAVIHVEGSRPLTGDIEIDLQPSGWKAHHHDTNPAFGNVVLHVVWSGGSAKSGRATLAMEPHLDAPWDELLPWLQAEGQPWQEEFLGRCCAPLKELAADSRNALIRQAALVRFQRKTDDLARRARAIGWDGALWEGLFRALGYKHNTWPMERLAALIHEDGAAQKPDTALALEARLLGLANLLPHESKARAGSTLPPHLQQLWNLWWRERERWDAVVLPATLWRRHGLRPANFPQRRLALAARWLAQPDFVARLEKWFLEDGSAETLLEKLLPSPDDHWSWHWTLDSARLAKPQPLLGAARATDLAVNVILPWFSARAEAGRNEPLVRRATNLWLAWPSSEDNSLLKQARIRLLGGNARGLAATAAGQQGLLQILRDFCARTNALCDGCQFPGLVEGLTKQPGG